jgi:peptidylprolyl isomerase
MADARDGDRVRVHYTGKLDDGEVFDSSREREPLEFQVGGGQVIAGFDEAIRGMSPGDEKTVRIPPDEAYGQRRDDMLMVVERERIPQDIDPAPGQQLQIAQGGQVAVVTVADVADDSITLDANHPLAGKALTFELELVEIV